MSTSSPPAFSTNQQVTSTAASSHDQYSIHTQREIDGLYDDLANLDATRTTAQTAAQTTLKQEKRKRSERASEVAMLRREVHNLQRTVQMSLFPYRDNVEEHNTLIDDYLYTSKRENHNDKLRKRS